MTDEQKINFLKNCFLFKQLPQEELTLLASQLREKVLSQNIVFIEEGLDGDEMYIIVEGLVKIFRFTDDGKEMTIAVKGDGDTVGELSLLDDDLRAANVQTLKLTKVLILRREAILVILSQYPTIAMNMLKNLAKIVRESNNYVEGLVSQSLLQRTERILQIISGHFLNKSITMSHEDLALLIGGTRPRITEALHELKRQGKISLTYKSIRFV